MHIKINQARLMWVRLYFHWRERHILPIDRFVFNYSCNCYSKTWILKTSTATFIFISLALFILISNFFTLKCLSWAHFIHFFVCARLIRKTSCYFIIVATTILDVTMNLLCSYCFIWLYFPYQFKRALTLNSAWFHSHSQANSNIFGNNLEHFFFVCDSDIVKWGTALIG